MSDSDEDSLPDSRSSVFTFQNQNMTIYAKGPHVNNTNNMPGSSYITNASTVSMHMPFNAGWRRYAGSNFDRTERMRRETSPMSVRSVSDFRRFGVNHSMYRHGTGYQRSVFNERAGSQVSDCTIDSSASFSVADITFAFKNRVFSSHDMKIILKEAQNALRKSRRKRIEKRRNLRLFMKDFRRKAGDDSSERESDSSISNGDDCRQVKSTFNKELISRSHNMRDVSHYSTNIQKQNDLEMFKDCTDRIKQNTMRNMLSNSGGMANGAKERIHNMSVLKEKNPPINVQNTSVMSQKERFEKGFLLPSQRFNKSVVTQVNGKGKISGNTMKNCNSSNVAGPDSDCDLEDSEEIFTRKDVSEKMNFQKKRTLDTEDIYYSDKKKSKLDLPNGIQNSKSLNSESSCNTNSNNKSDDFIFAKPKMPIKNLSKKTFGTEKLLAKSNVPPINEIDDFNIVQNNKSKTTEKDNSIEGENDTHSEVLHSTSDVSMRPSFIKRKLFTQKLDVAENKNLSLDSISANSPKNAYNESVREKNKTRKLVTSQSCLNREVTGEDSNVLDLIHKIVPPDQINLTNVANKTDQSNNQSNKDDNSEKWDVTAIVANCDYQNVSDTYTDDEIFNRTHQEEAKTLKSPEINKKKSCKVVMEKLNSPIMNKLLKNNKIHELPNTKLPGKETNRRRVMDCVKSFWDTDLDSESDMEHVTSSRINKQNIQVSSIQKRKRDQQDKLNISTNKTTVSKGILTVRNFHKDQKLNADKESQSHVIDRNKEVTEINNSKSVAARKTENKQTNTKVEKSNKDTNTKLQKGSKKKDINAKENVPAMKKQPESGRKPKSKVCTDCVNIDKQTNTPKKVNATVKLNKNIHTDKIKQVANNSFNKGKLTKTIQKSKDNKIICTPSKQTKKDSKTKISNSGVKNDTKSQKIVDNVRVQPHRKSKESSFTHSPEQKKNANNTKMQNNKPMIKSTKVLGSKNSLNSLNTKTTRSSREKLSFNSSGYDTSSMNISNISNRSLRLRQRKINEYK